MKRIIFILLILNTIFIFGKEEITIEYPLGTTDMYLYNNLEEHKLSGAYIDIFEKFNKENNNNYEYKYKLEGEIENPDIKIRLWDEIDNNYKYINTPYTTRIYILMKSSSDFSKLKYKGNIKIGVLGRKLTGLDYRRINSLNSRETIQYEYEEEAYKALSNEEIDLLYVVNLKKSSNDRVCYQIVDSINVRERIGIRRDKEELLKNLENFMIEINEDKNFLTRSNTENRIGYTRYLLKDTPIYNKIHEEYKVIKVSLPFGEEFSPYYYKDKKGKIVGVLPYILEDLERILEIPVEYTYSLDNWDILGVDFSSNESTQSRGYLRVNFGVMNKIEDMNIQSIKDLRDLKIVIKRDMEITKELKELDKKNIIMVDSFEELQEKIENKEADVALGIYEVLNSRNKNSKLGSKFKVRALNKEVGSEMTFNDIKLKEIMDIILNDFTTDELKYIEEVTKRAYEKKNYTVYIVAYGVSFGVILLLVWITIYERKRRKETNRQFVEIFKKLEKVNRAKDIKIGKHMNRVAKLSYLLGKELGFGERKLESIQKYSILHDIGIVTVPASILHKQGVYTEEEKEMMKLHSEMGYILIRGFKLGKRVENIVRYHHENWDGTGYPLGVKGKDIPLESRILRLTDYYDNARTDKPHRKALFHEEAVKEIKEKSGKWFDPQLVEKFLRIEKEFEKVYMFETEKDRDAFEECINILSSN